MQQYMLLQHNLIYTGITGGNRLVVLIRQKKSLAVAVRKNRTEQRFSGLGERLLDLRNGQAQEFGMNTDEHRFAINRARQQTGRERTANSCYQ